MSTQIISSLTTKLGIFSESVKRKAEELHRLVEIRSGSGAVNMSRVCQAVICLELAALQSGERIDRNEAVRLSGTPKKQYLNALGVIQCMLGLQSSVNISDLSVQFGCTEAKSLSVLILREYECTLGGREVSVSEQSTICAAALYTAAKKLKIKIDKRKLLEAASARRSVFDKIAQDMEKISANISDMNQKQVKSEGEKNIAAAIESISKESSTSNAGDDHNGNKRTLEDEDKEPYEDWKRRILTNAYKQLGRVYEG